MNLIEFHQYIQPKGSVFAIVLQIVASLVECFFGYLLYRLMMTVGGAILGAFIGVFIVQKFMPSPTTADYVVVCGGLAVLIAAVSFFLVRLTFAIQVLLTAGMVIPTMAVAHGQAWPAVVIGFAALVLACLSFIYLREIFIFSTALFGGLWASFCAFSLFGLSPYLHLGLTVVVGLGLAALGMRVQLAWSAKRERKLLAKSRTAKPKPQGKRK